MSDTTFATLEELKGRLDWTLSPDEERIAEGALEDASDLARGYGRDWLDSTHAPRLVRTLVLRACQRYMRNPDGYTQSRAGDETLGWSDTGKPGGAVTFEEDEIKLLQELAGNRGGIVSVSVTAWGPRRTAVEGLVPVEGGGKKFPLYALDESPW